LRNFGWSKLKIIFAAQKTLLLAVITISTLFPLVFVKLQEPTFTLVIFKLLAKAGSLCGATLLVWQFLLGFRDVAGKFIRDFLWVLEIHKKIGQYILLLIVMHPVFITLYYIEKEKINPLILQGQSPFKWWVLAGEIAFAVFLIVVLTSIFWRQKMGRTKWYTVHITSYFALAIVIVHAFAIGTTINKTRAFYYWIILTIIAAGFLLYRLLCGVGFFVKKHRVVSVEKVGPDVTRISCQPLGRKIVPHLGQFIYFRRGLKDSMRPFTVSHYQPQTGEFSITVKSAGRTTQNLQWIKPDEIVYIDGPYGIFSQTALESHRPIVMIAGGIGITAFTRLFEELAYEPDMEIHLFYGNQKKHEIVYKQELENVENVNVIHVLSDEPQYSGETGFITTDLLRKYLKKSLVNYEFLICGPPAMTEKLESALLSENVPDTQIHHELFDY